MDEKYYTMMVEAIEMLREVRNNISHNDFHNTVNSIIKEDFNNSVPLMTISGIVDKEFKRRLEILKNTPEGEEPQY